MTEGISPRYRLLGRIGAGGMAEVFRAELVSAEGITRELVIKRVHPRLALDPDAVRRFIDEARVAARLRHPNVVQVYEFGRDGDHYFLAMEFVEGCDLATLLRRTADGCLAPGVALAVIDALLDALEYVHATRTTDSVASGLVHRDVSPHNVLLGHAGEIKLADFGIAHVSAAKLADSDGRKIVEGKLSYMAPEQARGDHVDARADLFSAAAILQEMLTGDRVYGTATGDALRERATRGDVHIAAIDANIAALGDVLRRALAPSTDGRFDSVAAMHEALRTACDAMGLRADVNALRALVVRGAGPDAPAPLPTEPTLTDGAASSEGSVAAMSPPIASPVLRVRRAFLERVAIAIGVLVVSVLAERRTRPSVRPAGVVRSAAARGRALRVGLPTGLGETWWQPGLLRRLEGVVDVSVERVDLDGPLATARALRFGEVDIALVPSESLRALVTADAVRRLDTVLPEIDGAGYLSLRTLLRAEALRWGASVGGEGEGTYALPVAADLVAFGVSDAAMREANECVVTQRPALDSWLRSHSRLRLPSGASLRRELDGWTSWDLVLASWCWSRRGAHVGMHTPIDGAGVAAAVARWGSLGALADGFLPNAESMDAASEAISVLSAMSAFADPDGAREDPSVVARWAPLSWWSSHSVPGWSLARPPRGDRLMLDAMGDPLGEGQRSVVGRTWGWVLGRGSSRTARAARLLMLVTQEAARGSLVLELGGADATARVTVLPEPTGSFVRTAFEQSPFVRLDGPAALEEVESLAASTRALLADER